MITVHPDRDGTDRCLATTCTWHVASLKAAPTFQARKRLSERGVVTLVRTVDASPRRTLARSTRQRLPTTARCDSSRTRPLMTVPDGPVEPRSRIRAADQPSAVPPNRQRVDNASAGCYTTNGCDPTRYWVTGAIRNEAEPGSCGRVRRTECPVRYRRTEGRRRHRSPGPRRCTRVAQRGTGRSRC